MISYQMVGTNNFDKAVTFYETLLGELGAKRVLEEEGVFVGWGNGPEGASFYVTKPYDKQKATIGNGSMTAFGVKDAKQVETMYAKALELGATDEGKPGARFGGGFYAAYCRDLDGNKFNFFCMTE